MTRLNPTVREQMRALQAPGEPDLYIHLISIFLQSSDQFLAQAPVLVKTANAKSLRDVAHSWKSAAAALGADALAGLCEKLETAARNGESALYASLYAQICEEYAPVKAELQAIASNAG